MPFRPAPVTVDPAKMPRQYWAYVFYTVLGVPMLIIFFVLLGAQVRWLRALGALPAAASAGAAAAAGGAVHGGTLDGPVEVTPLGTPAVAWIGAVKRTTGHGKGRYTSEVCRLGSIANLTLIGGDAGAGARLIYRAPALRDVDLDFKFSGLRSSRPRVWLGPTTKLSSVPEEVARRCGLERAALTKDAWSYAEQAAPPGSHAEIAACLVGDRLVPCASGPAVGHLSTAGMRAILRRLTDATFGIAVLLVLVAAFFTIVGAFGAVAALRRAAR